jgi:hypothetical protein
MHKTCAKEVSLITLYFLHNSLHLPKPKCIMKRYLLLLAISCLPFISHAAVKDIMHADTTLHVGTARDTTRDGSSFEKLLLLKLLMITRA